MVMYTTLAVLKIRPEKISGLYGIQAHDLCDASAAILSVNCLVGY